MNKFVWTIQNSVKNNTIDEQHQMFFKIANSLLDMAERNDVTREEMMIKISELGNYALYHLGTEEVMFDTYDYPEKIEHIKSHNAFRETVNKMMKEAREDGHMKELSEKTANFAGEWLMNHIMVVDQRYADFFVSKGLK